MHASAVADIRNSYGAAFIGLIISTVMFGVTLGQIWIYFWCYWNKDPKRLKLFIVFITVMEILHFIISAYAIYWFLVLSFGNVENLNADLWALNLQAVIGAIYFSSIHIYYARRIYLLSRSLIFPILIVACIVFGDSLEVYISVMEFNTKLLAERYQRTLWMADGGMFTAIVVDATIAGSMCWALYRKKTGIARTDSMLRTLMAYTINSGLLSCLLGIAMAVSFKIAPSTLFSMAFYYVIGKCYVNSMLAMLNSREYVRDRSITDNRDSAFNISSIRIDTPSDAFGDKSRQTGVPVTVDHSAASGFAPTSNSDYKVEPTFEVSRPPKGTTIVPS